MNEKNLPSAVAEGVPQPLPSSAPASPPAGFGELLVLAWWFGVASGLLYALTQLAKRYALGQFGWVAPGALWLSPASYLFFFVPLVVAIAIVFRGRVVSRGAACGSLAFLAVLSQLLPYRQIAWWAQVMVALGVATQVTRFYLGSIERNRRWARRSATYATLLIACLVSAGQGARVLKRGRKVAALPSVDAASPNVLLIILDTVRGANMSLYGYPRPTTPHLDSLARESVVFDQAFATAPWTLPSHGTFMSGRYPWDQQYDWRQPIAPDGPVLAELLQHRGYRTGGFVANLLYTSSESGLSRGFIDYEEYPLSFWLMLSHSPLGQSRVVQEVLKVREPWQFKRALRRFSLIPVTLPADEVVSAQQITDRFLDWNARVEGRPYFAFLNYFDAHGPYRAPDRFFQQFGDTSKAENRYDAAIASLDYEVARLLATLAQRGTLDRTIVVISSDHGELFGEHGLTGHANSLYLPLLHVPLVIRYPTRVPSGRRIAEPVSLRDVAATILDLAGGTDSLPGRSLAWSWTGGGRDVSSPILSEVKRGANVDSTFPNAKTGLRSVLDTTHHYVRSDLGDEQLFAYTVDRAEEHDLLAAPADGIPPLPRLRAMLDSVARRVGQTNGRRP